MSIEGFLAKLRCPECRGGALRMDHQSSALLCTACGDRHPVVDGLPLLFSSANRAEFVAKDEDRRGTSAASQKPGKHHGGIYHWREYRIEDFLPPPEEGRDILQFGCGDAGEKKFLAETGFDAVAFDIRRSSGTDLLADGHNIPFQDSSFDVVVSMQVLEHLHTPWVAAREISRVLRPGGCFVGSVAFLKPYHASFFHMTHDGVERLLDSAGLTVDKFMGAQSVAHSVLGGMLPLGSLRFRRTVLGVADRVILGARKRIWARKTGLDPRQPTDRFSDVHALSFDDFDRLRFAPAVVFRARKSAGTRDSNC